MLYYLSHSAKGSTWKKHKYIKKENGRYYYPPKKGSDLPKPDTDKQQAERLSRLNEDIKNKSDELWEKEQELQLQRDIYNKSDKRFGEPDWIESTRRALKLSSMKTTRDATSQELKDLGDLLKKTQQRKLTRSEIIYNKGRYY